MDTAIWVNPFVETIRDWHSWIAGQFLAEPVKRTGWRHVMIVPIRDMNGVQKRCRVRLHN